jgi:hypothetical protein
MGNLPIPSRTDTPDGDNLLSPPERSVSDSMADDPLRQLWPDRRKPLQLLGSRPVDVERHLRTAL